MVEASPIQAKLNLSGIPIESAGVDVALTDSLIEMEDDEPQPPRRYALSHQQRRSYTSPNLSMLITIDSQKENARANHSASDATVPCDLLTQEKVNKTKTDAMNSKEAIDVFLGGSCNPTTWRRDVAVPLLDAAQIRYFNPQTDEWHEEMILKEALAKESARIVLMVIDSCTRSIVSINEAVEYICRRRQVVLVVQNMHMGTQVDGIVLSAAEIADLNGAREYLRRLAIRRGVHLYDSVAEAINGTIGCLIEDNPKACAPEMPRLWKRSSIVLNEWSRQFRPRRNTSRSWSSTALLGILSGLSDDVEGDEAFIGSPDRPVVVKHSGSSTSNSRGSSVYLGGNLKATSWRQIVAIPQFQLAGIPFYIPYEDYLSCDLKRLNSRQLATHAERWREMEAERDHAELILFVIPDCSRSIAAMTEAVELICNHHALLLVIEALTEGSVVDNDGYQIVGREYKDLCRARSYLQEMAERHDVEVFQSIPIAVNAIISRLT